MIIGKALATMYSAHFIVTLYRALQTSPHEGFAGSVLIVHPIEQPAAFTRFEETYRSACCGVDDPEFCNLFFSQRMIDEGENYVPPMVGKYYM